MNRRILCLSATLAILLLGNAGNATADDGIHAIELIGMWSVKRDFNDTGQWGQSAVFLNIRNVREVRGKFRATGILYIYQPNADMTMHSRAKKIWISGELTVKGRGKRKRWVSTLVDTKKTIKTSISFGRVANDQRGENRVVFRLHGRPNDLTRPSDDNFVNQDCDTPPDDDYLDPIPMNPGEEPAPTIPL